MSHEHVPDSVVNYIPEKLDFSNRALTKSNLDKKLAHQSEREKAKERITRKVKYEDKKLANKRPYIKNDLTTEEKKNLPIDIDEIMAVPEIEELNSEVIKKVLPKGIGKDNATRVTELINIAVKGMDPTLGEHFRDNCISWVGALKNLKTSTEQYINASKFVTYKLAGDSNVKAYAKTFPERVSRMANEKMSNEYLNTYANIYSRSKVVAEIYALALIPTHIMYQDYFHLAVKTQVSIMMDNKVSPKVRSDAASSLMTHLKTPEVKQAELKVTVSESDTISELRDVLAELSSKQHSDIIEGEYKVIDVSNKQIIKPEDEDE